MKANLLTLLIALVLTPAVHAHSAEELETLPLHERNKGDKILFVGTMGKEEILAEEQFKKRNIPYEMAENFDHTRTDYDGIFAIIGGANTVDHYSKKGEKEFEPIEKFVRSGGHLLLCGSFNGRNYHILEKFGVHTTHFHNEYLRPIPSRTEALLYGHMPSDAEDWKIRSYGRHVIDKPHISLMSRGKGYYEGETAFATMPLGKGRLSVTMIEPGSQGVLLIPAFIDWVNRGAPVDISQIDTSEEMESPADFNMTNLPEDYPLIEAQNATVTTAEKFQLEKELPFLEDAMVYTFNDFPNATAEFQVTRSGRAYMIAPWNINTPTVKMKAGTSKEVLNKWTPISYWGWGNEKEIHDLWLFMRDVKQGEHYKIRTSDVIAPIILTGKSVDLTKPEYEPYVTQALVINKFDAEIRSLFDEKQYDKLNEVIENLTSENPFFANGNSQLSRLCELLTSVDQTNAGYNEQLEKLQAWSEHSPESIVAKITIARLLQNHAYYARGEGTSNKVTDIQYKAFRKLSIEAYGILEQIDEKEYPYAELFNTKISNAMAIGGTAKQDVIDWVTQSIKADPWNTKPISSASIYLLPRWHGNQGELLHFANHLRDTAEDGLGEIYYAMVALTLASVNEYLVGEGGMDWEIIKQGFANFRKRFPYSESFTATEIKLSMAALDYDFTYDAVSKLYEQVDKGNLTTHQQSMLYYVYEVDRLEGVHDYIWYPHPNGTRRVTYSNSGDYLLTIGSEGIVRIWETKKYKLVAEKFLFQGVNSASFSSDETLLLGLSTGTVLIWDWKEDQLSFVSKTDNPIFYIQSAQNQRLAYFSDYLGTNQIIDVLSKETIHQGERIHGMVNIAEFSNDSKYCATTGSDGVVRIYDMSIGRIDKFLGTFDKNSSKPVSNHSLAYSKDDRFIATGNVAGTVTIWDVENSEQVAVSPKLPGMIMDLDFSPDGQYLLAACLNNRMPERGGLFLLNISSETPTATPIASSVFSCEFSADGKKFVTNGDDWSIRVYQTSRVLNPE